MRIAALEEALKGKTPESLERLAISLNVCIRELPEQINQELGLQLLETMVRLVWQGKKGGQKNGAEKSV